MGISLQKSQSVSLAKEAPNGLTQISLGVGWDVAKKGFFGGLLGGGGDIDLDASCITFDADKTVLESVWFGKLTNASGTIRHSGDNLTGEGDGDDESIAIQLDRLDSKVEYLVLTVNSFRGQTFDKVANAFGRVAGQLYIAWCIAAISLPVLAGWLYDQTQGYDQTMRIAAGVNLLGALLALSLPARARSRVQAQRIESNGVD